MVGRCGLTLVIEVLGVYGTRARLYRRVVAHFGVCWHAPGSPPQVPTRRGDGKHSNSCRVAAAPNGFSSAEGATHPPGDW